MISLQFLGAAGTVTGSKFLVETPGARVLVECGLFQGLKNLRLRNWTHLPVAPSSIDAVVITHAHLDHSGYLPLLVHNGFRGDVVCTSATSALCGIVLPDSARLQEEEARFANREGYSKHVPARPLYTEDDARRALTRFRTVESGDRHEIAPGVVATFRRAGHILGSGILSLSIGERTLVFSGDLGRESHPILRPPEPPDPADVIVVESTYGDRSHSDPGWVERFADAISDTVARGGSIVIPAFAVDRTEEVLFLLRRLMQDGAIPRMTVYVDSPMALKALDVYRRAIERRSDEIREEIRTPDIFEAGHLVRARTVDESKAINRVKEPSIIVSASGMATGGRVLHHLARLLPDPRNTVILPGFQAIGTRGRSLADGARAVKLLGRVVPVRASVLTVNAFSAHADAQETLAWLAKGPTPPAHTYVVHGEPDASDMLAKQINARSGWRARVPSYMETVEIT